MHNMDGVGIFFILIFCCAGLVVAIFFLLTLQKTLQRCAPESRTMEPGQVWLMLIPLFNIVWQFIVVQRISASLANEYRRRNIPIEPEPGKMIGLAYCILGVCGIIPILGILASIACLVCWIIYWVKIGGYSENISMPYTAPVQ